MMSGTGDINLSAQTSGQYAGILFLGDRSVSYGTGGGDNVFGGQGSRTMLQGASYFKTTALASATGTFAKRQVWENECTSGDRGRHDDSTMPARYSR
jgi:hypothetical protein